MSVKSNTDIEQKEGAYMTNLEIRRAAGGAGIKLWELAEALGVADATLSRKLRRELPDDEKQRILEVIDLLSKEANT